MRARYARIEVVVSGAVNRSGRAHLEAGSTVDTALEAAGGLAYRAGARPAGGLVLRRRAPSSRSVVVHRFRLFEGGAQPWRAFPLEQHDVLVFEWSLAPEAR
jgi:hypothetical protein